jgi:nitroreductase
MQNILLASCALGLGSVWLGVHNSPGRPEAIRRVLGIPDYINVLSIAAIGYPAEVKEPHKGYDSNKVHHNKW